MVDWRVVSKTRKVPKEIEAWIMLKDPLVARENGIGLTKVVIQGETTIGIGPTSARIAVVDYDMTHDKVIEGAELTKGSNPKFKTRFKVKDDRPKGDSVFDLKLNEIKLLESDFHFHQVNVWATIHKTMDLLEKPDILGRRIPWAFKEGRLKVLPHACYDENAYYDRGSGAICFGYFYNTNQASQEKGEQKMVFTCLSHDVITHELGHAILDGLKPYYNECTSAATAGFHEYFGDAIAITSLLSNLELVIQVAGREDSVLNSQNAIANIGKELGYGLDISPDYVRSAQNKKKVGELTEEQINSEHDYSEILSGAYYDFMEKVYLHRIEKKFAEIEGKKKGKKRNKKKGSVRVAALLDAAGITRRMMLRALDYCPPVDLNFHDYAQAVYRADKIAYPVEPNLHRDIWVEVCKDRQICESREEMDPPATILNSQLNNLDIDKLSSSETDAYDFIDANRNVLQLPPTANLNVINLYRTNKTSSDDFRVPQEIIIEFVWVSEVKLTGKGFGALANSYVNLWCGGTLVFSREGNILHYTLKNEDDERKLELKKYTKFLIKEGYLDVEGIDKGLGAGMARKVTARIVDGKVSLTRNASMRCKRKRSEGHSHV